MIITFCFHLDEQERSTTFAVAIARRASDNYVYDDTLRKEEINKKEANKWRATTFAIAKLEEW